MKYFSSFSDIFLFIVFHVFLISSFSFISDIISYIILLTSFSSPTLLMDQYCDYWSMNMVFVNYQNDFVLSHGIYDVFSLFSVKDIVQGKVLLVKS